MNLPHDFRRTIIDLFNDRGREWLDNLPTIIADGERRWNLTALPPFDLTYNYVAPAVRADGTEVVLKLGVPDGALTDEMTALRLWDGHGIVQLLDCDPDRGIMLLERLTPGRPLITIEDDEEATRIFASVARQLWRPAPAVHNFDTPGSWAEGMKRLRKRFDGGTGPLQKNLVETAESLYAELLDSQSEPALIHGDLHHWNILSAGREPWLALDPKGIVGEPCYEVGAWLRNPVGAFFARPDLPRVFDRRVAILAEELGFDRQRIVGWGVAQAVLSAWWSIEDHGEGWEESMQCAEILSELLR
ncbi:MAG TPA: aminoglycoside phosphotransferase family protein [Anaerolineales bacterium]|nr:aminoglycoside phosphotransferase family protein [Anaerolineales bacterium]